MRASGLTVALRSRREAIQRHTQVYLADTTGTHGTADLHSQVTACFYLPEVESMGLRFNVTHRHHHHYLCTMRVLHYVSSMCVKLYALSLIGRLYCAGAVFGVAGRMDLWYSLASLAFVGGSLVPGIGGHNLSEAAFCSCAVVVGE